MSLSSWLIIVSRMKIYQCLLVFFCLLSGCKQNAPFNMKQLLNGCFRYDTPLHKYDRDDGMHRTFIYRFEGTNVYLKYLDTVDILLENSQHGKIKEEPFGVVRVLSESVISVKANNDYAGETRFQFERVKEQIFLQQLFDDNYPLSDYEDEYSILRYIKDCHISEWNRYLPKGEQIFLQ